MVQAASVKQRAHKLKLPEPPKFPTLTNYRRSLLNVGSQGRLKRNQRAGLDLNTISQPAVATARKTAWSGWLPLLALPAVLILLRSGMPAWLFMWSLSFAIFVSLKWMTWWTARTRIAHSATRSFAYLLAWPGMDAETFLDSDRRAQRPNLRKWLWAATKTAFGVAFLWVIARRVPDTQLLLRGWTGLFGLIFLLHFGSFHLIALFWQAMGIDAQPIMSRPVLSRSLSEFWGKRWNLGFRQLAHEFIFQPLHRRIGTAAAAFLVFVASGLIHDVVISLPARGGYGLPTGYFIFQGLGVTLERSALGAQLRLQSGLSARIFAIVVTAGLAFYLFHPPFVLRVILPFMHAVHCL